MSFGEWRMPAGEWWARGGRREAGRGGEVAAYRHVPGTQPRLR